MAHQTVAVVEVRMTTGTTAFNVEIRDNLANQVIQIVTQGEWQATKLESELVFMGFDSLPRIRREL